jgi:hypothetical protein
MTQRKEHSWNEWDYENRRTPVWVMMLTSVSCWIITNESRPHLLSYVLKFAAALTVTLISSTGSSRQMSFHFSSYCCWPSSTLNYTAGMWGRSSSVPVSFLWLFENCSKCFLSSFVVFITRRALRLAFIPENKLFRFRFMNTESGVSASNLKQVTEQKSTSLPFADTFHLYFVRYHRYKQSYIVLLSWERKFGLLARFKNVSAYE